MRAKNRQSEAAQKSIEQYVSDIYAKFLTSSFSPAKHDNNSLNLTKKQSLYNKESASQEFIAEELKRILYNLEKTYGYSIEKEGEDDKKNLLNYCKKLSRKKKTGKSKLAVMKPRQYCALLAIN